MQLVNGKVVISRGRYTDSELPAAGVEIQVAEGWRAQRRLLVVLLFISLSCEF